MNSGLRSISIAVTLALVTLWMMPGTLAQARGGAQTRRAQPSRPAQPAQPAPAIKPPTGWTQKTPDGQPDLQGFWSVGSARMITSPEGGIPPLSAEGEKRQRELADRPAAGRGHCVPGNSDGPPLLSPNYSSNLQIVQAKGYVMIVQETMHGARLIPIDNRPHLDGSVTHWFGDSRGYWEGETLVVETTNYSGRNPFQRITSDKLKVTERFKRIDETTLEYEFTIDDPAWTEPWTAELRWARIDGPLREYACNK